MLGFSSFFARDTAAVKRHNRHDQRGAAMTYAVPYAVQPFSRRTFVWASMPFDVQSLEVVANRSRGWWSGQPGVYIFAEQTEEYLAPLYVGRTRCLKNRLPYHKIWDIAVAHGATHLHTRVEPHFGYRVNLERLLIAVFRPPLNKHYRRWRVREEDRSFALICSF
jgi:hypothetical protein